MFKGYERLLKRLSKPLMEKQEKIENEKKYKIKKERK